MKTQIIKGTLLTTGFIILIALVSFGDVVEEQPTDTVGIEHQFIPTETVEAQDSLLVWQTGRRVYQGEPFSGNLIERYADSRVKARTDYVNGKRHGIFMQWYPDGIVKEVRYYTGGAKVAVHTGWWPDGEIKFSYAFKDGQYHGDLREWYNGGQPSKAFYYQDGRETGAQKAWRENGKLYINLVYKKGRRYGIAKQKACFAIVDGKRKGVGDERYDVVDSVSADDGRLSVQ